MANRAYVCFLLIDHELGNKFDVILFLSLHDDNCLYNFGFENELFHLPFGNLLFSHTNTNNGSLRREVILVPSHVASDSI